MEDLYFIRPSYSNGVKVSGWECRRQAYPYDYPVSVKYAHYRSFGPNNDVNIPQTTTQEQMEQGIISRGPENIREGKRRPMINFISFPAKERFALLENPKNICDSVNDKKKTEITLTTYKRSYVDHRKRPIKVPEPIPDIQDVHPLFNRISKNDFELISPLAPYKFMDDHLYNQSPGKKLANHYKQIRFVSYNPWLGVFR